MQLDTIKKDIILTLRRYKGFIRITFKNGIPRLHVHEKFERHIKWSLRIITLIGIIASVISFSVWYLNLFVAILLVAIEQFLERIIFIFTTIFITPFPESYKSDDWKGMVWGYPLDNGDSPYIIAPLFASKESARKIFNCLRSWNYDSAEDFSDNIAISVILEETDDYSLYMYPGMNRISEKQWRKEAVQMHSGREHQGLIMQMTFCKQFKYSGSSLVEFLKKYKEGQKFKFEAYYVELGNVAKINELGYILKNHIKIKKRSELTSKDLELDHGRFVMNL